ncbi:MAG: hypothetical protein LBJ32_00555 [Oscillospiraceae bacterium]|nr:hypothetical protein [Oscillospiraceae bacterium]
MRDKIKITRSFLGTSSPSGFYSKFDVFYNPADGWYCHVLKGSPGCGKSTMIHKIAEAGIKNKTETEFIHCSADPDSLDGVVFPELKACVVDGTAPHVLDPVYPGAVEHIVNLGEYWNAKRLKASRDGIIESNNANVVLQIRAKKYLAAYGAVFSDSLESAIEKIDPGKIRNYAKKMEKIIFTSYLDKTAIETPRFISAITPQGVIFYEENLEYFENIFEIMDRYGIIGDILLKYIRSAAISNGYDITTCYNPLTLNERIEAILIPKLNTALVVSNDWHSLSDEIQYKRIHSSRFLIDGAEIKENPFNKKIERELIFEAISSMKKAKKVHDDLEDFYVKAIDFEALNKLTEKIISEIF